MTRPRGTGSIFQYKGCGNWFLKYYRNGVPVRELQERITSGRPKKYSSSAWPK